MRLTPGRRGRHRPGVCSCTSRRSQLPKRPRACRPRGWREYRRPWGTCPGQRRPGRESTEVSSCFHCFKTFFFVKHFFYIGKVFCITAIETTQGRQGHVGNAMQGIQKGKVSLYHWPPFLTGSESAVWQLTFFCFYLQNILIQTGQAGGQWYSDTSPLSLTCAMIGHDTNRTNQGVHAIVLDSVTLSSLRVVSRQTWLIEINLCWCSWPIS